MRVKLLRLRPRILVQPLRLIPMTFTLPDGDNEADLYLTGPRRSHFVLKRILRLQMVILILPIAPAIAMVIPPEMAVTRIMNSTWL